MCKLLIQRTNRLPPGDDRHHQFHAAGDVIAVLADGWVFGAEEYTHPDFWIVSVPGIAEHHAAWLLAPMRCGEGQLPHLRAFALDLEHPAVAGKAVVTAADLNAARIAREPIQDRRHFGINKRVIG